MIQTLILCLVLTLGRPKKTFEIMKPECLSFHSFAASKQGSPTLLGVVGGRLRLTSGQGVRSSKTSIPAARPLHDSPKDNIETPTPRHRIQSSRKVTTHVVNTVGAACTIPPSFLGSGYVKSCRTLSFEWFLISTSKHRRCKDHNEVFRLSCLHCI